MMSEQWNEEYAWSWYRNQPWLCGFNYLPSSAVNTTEMWQHETFDPDTIRRELSSARDIGLNCCRVSVQYLVWAADPDGFLERLDTFLAIADENKIVTLVLLFDDCAFAGKEPYLGPQDEPVPGIHNSGWTPCPGPTRADNTSEWPRFHEYVTSVVSRFAADPRLLGWDVYNEPGNSDRFAYSLPLLEAAFEWTREAAPTQPVTSGLWAWEEGFHAINDFLLAHSDILTFHEYGGLERQGEVLPRLRQSGRPILCTEWMSRTLGSPFETHLPFFYQEAIGCFFWGLVNGRTQTHFPWGSPENALPPPLWFHDLLHTDGTPYREAEVALIRQIVKIPPCESRPSVLY